MTGSSLSNSHPEFEFQFLLLFFAVILILILILKSPLLVKTSTNSQCTLTCGTSLSLTSSDKNSPAENSSFPAAGCSPRRISRRSPWPPSGGARSSWPWPRRPRGRGRRSCLEIRIPMCFFGKRERVGDRPIIIIQYVGRRRWGLCRAHATNATACIALFELSGMRMDRDHHHY